MRLGLGWWRSLRARDPRHERERAARHFGRRRWRRALRAYRRLAELTPADAFVYVRVGDCARQLNRTADAIAAYEQAVRSYVEAGDWTKAAATCRLVVPLAPGDETVTQRLASLESRRRLGKAAAPSTPQVLDVQISSRPARRLQVEGWEADRPVETNRWGVIDFDEGGRPLVAGRAVEAVPEQTPVPRGARRTARLAEILRPEPAAPDEAMPEAVFEEIYAAFSSGGRRITGEPLDEKVEPTPAQPPVDEPCTCGRCHLCRREATQRFARKPVTG